MLVKFAVYREDLRGTKAGNGPISQCLEDVYLNVDELKMIRPVTEAYAIRGFKSEHPLEDKKDWLEITIKKKWNNLEEDVILFAPMNMRSFRTALKQARRTKTEIRKAAEYEASS